MHTLGEEKIDLLLTDIQMPVINGLELMKTIRSGKSPTPRNLCTIIVTSFTNTETLGSAMAMDFNGFLTKPFKPVTVMKTIMQALSKKDTQLREDNSYLEVKTVKGVLLLSAGFVLRKNTISRLIELDAVITNNEFHVELIEE